MNIIAGNMYFVSNDFFDLIQDPHLKRNYEATKRPHYYAFKDMSTSLYWLVPCSSKVEKFERIIEAKKAKKRSSDTIQIVNIFGKKSVLLFQDMFPITEKYISEQYYKGGQPVRITNPKIVKDLELLARQTIIMLHKGVKFTPTQPDVLRIEKLMLRELNM